MYMNEKAEEFESLNMYRNNVGEAESNSNESGLFVTLGQTEEKKIFVRNLAQTSHILIAGPTGSGKTCFIQSILTLLVDRYSSDYLKLIIYDAKAIDYNTFNGLPHLLIPVINDAKKCTGMFGWISNEVDKRYKIFADVNSRGIEQYNKSQEEKLPYIIPVIDGLDEVMLTEQENIDSAVSYIAQKARAAGIIMILSSSHPSAKVVTTAIKSNISCRVAFHTVSRLDSRLILDENGAENLSTPGEIIYKDQLTQKKLRSTYIPQDEMDQILINLKHSQNAKISDLSQMATSAFTGAMQKNLEMTETNTGAAEIERLFDIAVDRYTGTSLSNVPENDTLLSEAINFVIHAGTASTSLLQRKLRLGYARAAHLLDLMEARGVVGPYNGSKPRKVLISDDRTQSQSISSNDRQTNSDENSTKIKLHSFPEICCNGTTIQISNNEIKIEHPTSVTGIKYQNINLNYCLLNGSMLQQLIYKKSGIFKNGHITFVVSADAFRVNGISEIPISTPSVSITIEFNRSNDAIFSQMLFQISKDTNIAIDRL